MTAITLKKIFRILLCDELDSYIEKDDIMDSVNKGRENIDNAIATLNGDPEWFLCLTKDEKVCKVKEDD